MKSFLIIVVFLSVFTNITAQDYWQQANGPYGGNITFLNTNSIGYIYASTFWDGMYRSSDGGNSWTYLGFKDNTINSVVINSSDYIFLSGDQNRYIYRSTDYGFSWSALSISSVTTLSINSNDHIYAGTAWGGVYRSTDNGMHWKSN